MKTLNMSLPWPTGGNEKKSSHELGDFGNDEILVVEFKTGEVGFHGSISVSEYRSAPAPRTATISKTKGEFGGPRGLHIVGTTPNLQFTVGPNSIGYPALEPNTTYYLNVKNAGRNGAPTCPAGRNCAVLVELRAVKV